MNPVLIAAGIYLSARIISFIAGELSESELKKQKEIDAEIERIRTAYYKSENNSKVRADDENVAEEKDIFEAVEKSDVLCEKRKKIIDFLKEAATTRKIDMESLHNEIKEAKRTVMASLKSQNEVQTPLRRSSLELLYRQLSEVQEKCYAYLNYLELYQEEIVKKSKENEPPLFLWQLPQNYPYVGKVLWINTDQITNRYLEYEIPELYKLKISIQDINESEYIDHSLVPIMITKGRKKEYFGSLEKGAFKAYELSNTHLGVSATVKEIQRDHIILVYQNTLELFLHRDNLIKPDRFPPIRSTLMVYPIKWEYNLSYFSYPNGKVGYPVMVSERKEDAGSSLAFKNFPICFSENDFVLFKDYYNANNLQDYNEEFLIGPVSQNDVILQKGSILKLQLGDIPLFFVEVDEHPDREDVLRYYFRFHSMCGNNEKTFSADDTFLPFDVCFTPYYAGTSVEMIQQYMDIDDIDDVVALIWDLFEEFRIQDQIRKDREGMGYFFKWESITNQLISVLEQGDSILLDVNVDNVQRRDSIFADVISLEKLKNLIQRFDQKTNALIMHEWKPQFFVKDEAGNRYPTTVLDAGRRLKIVGKNVARNFFDGLGQIEFYASNKPYAEYQQKVALRQFRIGQVVNPVIQAACLNSSNFLSVFDERKILKSFHNDLLANNESQKKAVEMSFAEKNLFFIQGPPGTGKTTVIRELVEQVMESENDSRILIVSQANVAVDNALSGLIEIYGNEIVRCGVGNKISPIFQKMRLQSRCEEYLDDLQYRRDNFDKKFYHSWNDIVVCNDSYEYSPALCELIIRNHRLIGATCVGLSKRKIGLERTEFDLVIIDEAGKALPAEMLIPLVRAKKAVIIGDHRQLPPVINPVLYDEEKINLEERAISENDLFCHSFFERLYNNAPDNCKIMLDTQFRMPAVIGTIISELFYEGKLKNGVGTEQRLPVLFDTNLVFIDFDGNKAYHEDRDNCKQLTNKVEAKSVVSLVKKIREKDSKCKIAVITPYRGQKRLISNSFIKGGLRYQLNNIAVDTIDSFQGDEADIVIFCTTRSTTPTLFFKDQKRLNVALSRAKRELIILGRLRYFYLYNRSESCLPKLADYIKKNGEIITYNSLPFLSKADDDNSDNEIMVSIEEISVPSEFVLEETDEAKIQDKVTEYYNNGDFLQPFSVKKVDLGFLLQGDYEQFIAAQELGISECLCRIVY